MRPGICLGCRGPRRFPPLPSLPQGPTCVWLDGGAAAGHIPRSQRTPRLAGKPSRRSEGTQAVRREKSTVEPERKGISSVSTVGSQFPPKPYNVHKLPARRSCAVLPEASSASESGNFFVIWRVLPVGLTAVCGVFAMCAVGQPHSSIRPGLGVDFRFGGPVAAALAEMGCS